MIEISEVRNALADGMTRLSACNVLACKDGRASSVQPEAIATNEIFKTLFNC